MDVKTLPHTLALTGIFGRAQKIKGASMAEHHNNNEIDNFMAQM